MLQIILPETCEEMRCDRAVARFLPEIPEKWVREAFERRDVKSDGVRVRPQAIVGAGTLLQVYTMPLPPQPIVWQGNGYFLYNKPQGLPTVDETAGSAVSVLSRALGEQVFPCHRLDAQTGGLLLFSKTAEGEEQARKWFEAHEVVKKYRCLVRGCPKQDRGDLRAWLVKDAYEARVHVLDHSAPDALTIRTEYEVVERGEVSRLEVTLHTGRTHQIRAHLAHEGFPILGDDKYGDRAFNRRMGTRRQCLWSVELRLPDGSGARIKEPF